MTEDTEDEAPDKTSVANDNTDTDGKKIPQKGSADVGSNSDGSSSVSKQEAIETLQSVAQEGGESPSVGQFKSVETDISVSQIRWVFPTWNAAKRAAGLDTTSAASGGSPHTQINETYFAELDSPETVYWLGTLIANSQVRTTTEGKRLIVARTEEKSHFVYGLARAIESEYTIHTYTPEDDTSQPRVQTHISNTEFVKTLLKAGYPRQDESSPEFPEIPVEYRPAFVRGYLESAGQFVSGSSGGWEVSLETYSQGETFYDWVTEFGAKQPTLSTETTAANPVIVYVHNRFDIRRVFETCWPDQAETTPSWSPYPEKILRFLSDKYPYPENLEYL